MFFDEKRQLPKTSQLSPAPVCGKERLEAFTIFFLLLPLLCIIALFGWKR
jgi:hypothetical protein